MCAWYVGSVVLVRTMERDKIYMVDADTWLLDDIALRQINALNKY